MAEIVKLDDGYHGIDALEGCACAFGVFDGFHRGHRYLVEQAIVDARQHGISSAVVTFDIDPDEIFNPQGIVKLSSNDERLLTLASTEVDRVIAFHFTREFAALEPRRFLDVTFGSSTPASVHVGSDFRFGRKAAGNLTLLNSWGFEHGMRVIGHDLQKETGTPITATRIRQLLAQEAGIEEANQLLGHAFKMSGTVEAGRQAGREFGFRTANVAIAKNMRALAPGVYAAYTHIEEKPFKAAVSIGTPPTFEGQTKAYCEAHILDFEGDLYGKKISLEFVSWIRPLIKFKSNDELIETVMGNISWVRDNL